MKDKIFAVSVWATMICVLVAYYQFAGWRGFCTGLLSAIFYGLIALIIKRDRDNQIENLSRYQGEVHNLRLTISEAQERIYEANCLLIKYGAKEHIKMPQIFSSLLPSVFDRKETSKLPKT